MPKTKPKGYRIRVKNRFGTYDTNKTFKTKRQAQKIAKLQRTADKNITNPGLTKKNSILKTQFRTKNKYYVVKYISQEAQNNRE